MNDAILAAKPTWVSDGFNRHFYLWNAAILPTDWRQRAEPHTDELRRKHWTRYADDPLNVAWALRDVVGAMILDAWVTPTTNPICSRLRFALARHGWGIDLTPIQRGQWHLTPTSSRPVSRTISRDSSGGAAALR